MQSLQPIYDLYVYAIFVGQQCDTHTHPSPKAQNILLSDAY